MTIKNFYIWQRFVPSVKKLLAEKKNYHGRIISIYGGDMI
jgi:hypothetical protein